MTDDEYAAIFRALSQRYGEDIAADACSRTWEVDPLSPKSYAWRTAFHLVQDAIRSRRGRGRTEDGRGPTRTCEPIPADDTLGDTGPCVLEPLQERLLIARTALRACTPHQLQRGFERVRGPHFKRAP